MIKNSNQSWEIGCTVKVGFLSNLVVTAKIATPGDHAPDAYVLVRGTTFYSFVPHMGLSKITQDEAVEMIREGLRQEEKAQAAKLEKKGQAEFVKNLLVTLHRGNVNALLLNPEALRGQA